MKNLIVWVLLLSIFTSCQNKTENKNNLQNHSKMDQNTENTAIEKSLGIYFDALNKSNVEQAVGQYTNDGIFMPAGLPTASGTEQLNNAYGNVFKALQLNVTFKTEEIVFLGSEVAFVRTQSQGTQLIHATGKKTEELNREFFLMKKVNSDWKIERYMFNQPK